jgi:pSer/pThr/pTyr-binding forkhead associated (FHA) protein
MQPRPPLRLRLTSPGLPPEEHRLAGPVVELGRSDMGDRPDLELRAPPGVVPAASRRHARLLREGTGWVILDLGSTNGTWLNGRRLPAGQPAPVQPGDHLRLGETAVEILPEAAPAPSKQPSVPQPAAAAALHTTRRPPLPRLRIAQTALGTLAAALLLVAVIPDWRARAWSCCYQGRYPTWSPSQFRIEERSIFVFETP